MKMNDTRLKKMHADHVFLARKVEQGAVLPSLTGCSGLNSIVKHLDFVHAMNFFVVPAAPGGAACSLALRLASGLQC